MTIVKTFDTQSSQDRFPKKYIVMAVICFVTLIITEIWASNTAIAYGEKYEKLSVMEKNFKMENQILENDIANNSSLKTIASKSAELGFSSKVSVEYIR